MCNPHQTGYYNAQRHAACMKNLEREGMNGLEVKQLCTTSPINHEVDLSL